MEEKSSREIDNEIKILQIQKELIDSKSWDDKTHLERKYEMHLNNFYNVIRDLCGPLGIFGLKRDEDGKGYSLKLQSGETRGFTIGRDYNNQKGRDKLVSYMEINDKTKASAVLFYSPTKGVNFEYSANLMRENIQLGKNDFFGKSVENMIKKIDSATDGVDYYVRLDRFNKVPCGLKEFCIGTGKKTEQFIPKEKQGDVISIIATLDGLVRGLHSIPQGWLHGENFKHQDSEPLFKIGIKISI